MPSSRPADDPAEQIEAVIEEVRSVLFAPGEHVPGWDVGGANPDAEVRAMGADRYYQLSRSEGSFGVTILTDRPIEDFAPRNWRVADSLGEAGAQLVNPQLDFHPLSDRYVIAGRTNTWEQNDVRCYRDSSHAILYEIPGAPERPDDGLIPFMFRVLLLIAERQTVCSRMDGNRRDGYQIRYFLPDGRSLPALSTADDLTTIVPAAPIDQLIRAGQPRSPEN